MKKIFFVLLALMISQSVRAEWLDIGGGVGVRVYADPTRIESYSRIYQSIWTMNDYKTIQPATYTKKPFMSVVQRLIVDCARQESRIIGSFWYSENMGKIWLCST